MPSRLATTASDESPSPEAIQAHPEATNPFNLAILVNALWQSGRREQAAFWFYVFQIRTRPWAAADKVGDGAAALRGALNDSLGGLINPWVASDLDGWKRLAARAVTYERHLPLSPERPPGVDAATWQRQVTASRAEYAAQMHGMLDTLTPADFAAKRREGGLPVGPWDQPGPPLPDAWR